MHINRVRKIASGLSERAVSAEETLSRAAAIASARGVRRIADITGLDRIGIPVFTAVVPKSDDILTVYNGKGCLAIEARIGALMESIERQTALNASIETVTGSFSDLRDATPVAIDPQLFNHKLRDDYSAVKPYMWTRGFDLIAGTEVLVPAVLAGFGPRFAGQGSPFHGYSSNGLASGNCVEEAVCHALCELVERDAWTLADLRSCWIPRARREAFPVAGAVDLDDCSACPLIDLKEAGAPISDLMEKFERAGLSPVVRDITSDLGVACAIASAVDEWTGGSPQAHSGLGAHPNARIAVIRALTELAQSRAVDIQGVREDILPAEAVPSPYERHTKRVSRIDHNRWLLRNEGRRIAFADVLSTENDDIADDIELILKALRTHGIERAIVVDLSEPGGFSVVRAVVPGLEFWILDRGKLGDRAMQFWKQHAAAA